VHRRSRPTVISSVVLLSLVLALVAAVPAPDAGAALPRPATIHDELAAELLAGDPPPDATATAIVTAHDPSQLDAIEAAGVTGNRLEALGMLIVPALSGAQLVALQQLPEVRSVWGVEELELHMQETVWVTGAREVWEDHGYTGAGVELGVVDTGADGTHQDFGNLIEFCNASATGTAGLVLCTTDRREAVDDNGHGTHVAGTMAGTGRASGGRADPHATIGMAPDAKIRSYAANVAASLLNTDILAAYDDLIAKKRSGENDIVAINNSFGGGIGADYDPDDPQAIAYRTANEAGMLPVFSAGNSGPEDNTLGRQCLSPYVLCVGASTKTDGITAFSSVGRPAAPHPQAPGDGEDEGEEDLGRYGNHDRALARAFDLGVYRPGIVAPGAVINAMSANAPLCRDGMLEPQGCYEELQGTSMSAPHVTGAAALVAEAFRDAHGRTPTADELLDILERSATPLPGHPAEQQGAGRLDVPAAIDLALRYEGDGTSEPAWVAVGTPIPTYVEGKHPGGDTLVDRHVGCTGPGSFTLRDEAGVTTFEVPAGAHELTVDVDWGAYHPEANLYLELFRPGHDPARSTDDPGPTRTFPVAESAGLVHTDPIVDDVGPPATSRSVTFAGPEDGEWSLRVTHRVGATVQACQAEAANTDDTQRAEGFSYDVEVHVTQVADLPTTTLHRGDDDGDTASLFGAASYPAPFEGVTTWAVDGTGSGAAADEDIERTTYYLRGGTTDTLGDGGSFGTDEPDGTTPATQTAASSLANPDVPFNPLAITWTGPYQGRIDGDLRFDWWWATPNPLGGLIDVEVVVTVFADPDPDGGEQPDAVIGRRTTRLQALPEVLGAVHNRTDVPVRGEVADTLQVQVTPVYVDTGPLLTAVYGAADTPSSFGVPAGTGGPTADVDAPANLRVTDLQDRLRVAWDPVDGADGYAVYRSTDPAFVPGPDTLLGTTAGTECRAPDVPSWPGASRAGRCVIDAGVERGVTYYYRVAAVEGGTPGPATSLGYGTARAPERQARVQVDRLFGPGYWELAAADDGVERWWHAWDLRGVDDPSEPRARVFSQGVGSLAAGVTEAPDDDPGGPSDPEDPGEPDDPRRPGPPAERPGPPGDRPRPPGRG
jgi:serine protease AprX